MKTKIAERNYAGIPYLYRKKGAVSTVVEINMVDPVDGFVLQECVDQAMEYHPYMSSSITEYKGERYLTACNSPFEVAQTRQLRKLGGKETNYHLVDVTYYDHDIYVAFHHALCDGTGIKKFTELLLSLYLRQQYKIKDFVIREDLLSNENDRYDAFSNSFYRIAKTKAKTKVERKGMHLPEVPNKMNDDSDNRYTFLLDNDSLMQYAKAHGASPAIILSILLSKSIKQLNPDDKRPVVCNLASDLRESLGANGTMKNTVNSIYLPYSDESEQLSTDTLVKQYRTLIKEQKETNYVRSCANMMVGLFRFANILPTIRAKQVLLSAFENIKINTYMLSYPGRLQLSGLERYISSCQLYSSGNNGFYVNVMSVNNTTSITILQSFASERYVEAFKEQLEENGIPFTYKKCGKLLTPRDDIMCNAPAPIALTPIARNVTA